MGQQPICILHTEKPSQSCGNIKLFVENFDKWLKVQECLRRRRGQQGSSKYLEIISSFGRSFKPLHGYHSNYYKNLTATPERQTQESHSQQGSHVLVNQQISLEIQVFFLLKAYYEGNKEGNLKENGTNWLKLKHLTLK